MSKPTDVYIWGNGNLHSLIKSFYKNFIVGVQIDQSLDYNNYFPKKISNFSKEDGPQIIIVKFGEFHEFYLDKEGRIHACRKHKLPSSKVDYIDDNFRENIKTLSVPAQGKTLSYIYSICFYEKTLL